jgi:hypothetical protein
MRKQQNQTEELTRGVGRVRMLVAAMIAGLLLNPPLLEIFSVDPLARLLGWPLVLFYINMIWILLIIMIFMPKIGSWVKGATLVVQRLLGKRSA